MAIFGYTNDVKIETVDNNTDYYIRVGKRLYDKTDGRKRGSWSEVLFALTPEVEEWIENPEKKKETLERQRRIENLKEADRQFKRDEELDEELTVGKFDIWESESDGYRYKTFRFNGVELAEVKQYKSHGEVRIWEEATVKTRTEVKRKVFVMLLKAMDEAMKIAEKWNEEGRELREGAYNYKKLRTRQELAELKAIEAQYEEVKEDAEF